MTDPDQPDQPDQPETEAERRAHQHRQHGRAWLAHLHAQLRGEALPAQLDQADQNERDNTR